MNYGNRIKELRSEEGLTQKQFAEIMGISKSNVSKYEAGQVEPNIDTIIEIANHFDVCTDYLLGISDDRHPPGEYEWRPIHVKTRIGTILEKYQQHYNVNNAEFAESLGITEELLVDFKSGRHTAYSDFLQKIHDVTGYDMDYLMGATNKSNDKNGFFESDMTFRSRLEERCLRKGLTKDNVEEKTGIAANEFSNILHNRMPTLSEVLKLSWFFDVSIDYLIGRSDVPLSSLSPDELDLILNYRDCIDSYKKNILDRAYRLSIESVTNGPDIAPPDSVAADGGTGTDGLGK